MRSLDELQEKPWSFTTRLVGNPDTARAPLEFSLVRQWTPEFRFGVLRIPKDDSWSPIWNYRFWDSEDRATTAAIGQSGAWPSSRTTGAAYSLTAGHSWGGGLSTYASASYAPDANLWYIPMGARWKFDPNWSTRVMWDGIELHPAVTYHQDGWNLSFLMLDGRDPTLSFSVAF